MEFEAENRVARKVAMCTHVRLDPTVNEGVGLQSVFPTK